MLPPIHTTRDTMQESEFAVTLIHREYRKQTTIYKVHYMPIGRTIGSTSVSCTSEKQALDTLVDKWEQYEDWYREINGDVTDTEFDLKSLSWNFYITAHVSIGCVSYLGTNQ